MSEADVIRHQAKHGFLPQGPVNAPESPIAAFKPKRGAREPNKTEAAFKAYMDTLRGSRLVFEPVKVRIGPNCYYTPDYGDLDALDLPIFYEVKGGWITDDGIVKFKAAKERHTWASFEMWQKKKGEWTRLL